MDTPRTPNTQRQTRVSRRQFLKITAVAGSLAGLGALGIDTLQRAKSVRRVQSTRLLLGTVANLTVIAQHEDAAEAAIEATFHRMAALERIMSRFQPDSQLSHLNATGSLNDPHPALVEVLRRADYYSQLTDGAFDVTIEPVLALYRTHATQGTLPAPSTVAQQRALVNFRKLAISADYVQFQQPHMAITLDGIAKGYIIDQGTAELRERGFDHVLVELGGDMQAGGTADDRPWQIVLQPPRATMTAQRTLVAQLQNRALATSGDYMHAFTPDFRLHHILNPGTGNSPQELSSASVIAPTACDADALATAAMVLGADRLLALLVRLPETEAVLVRKDGSQLQTATFPRL